MNFLQQIQEYAEQPITTQLLLGLLKEYRRPYDRIDDLEQKGYLVQIRRGLYVTTHLIHSRGPEPFLIANHLYGPSYVSVDSAMFQWGLIPERVYEISSTTTRLSKQFQTKVGSYKYIHLPMPYYSFGIAQLSLTEKQTVLIASPEKAVCDKIITTAGIQIRSKKQAISYLVEDLRIEKESLRKLNTREMMQWLPDCPKQESIKVLIETVADL